MPKSAAAIIESAEIYDFAAVEAVSDSVLAIEGGLQETNKDDIHRQYFESSSQWADLQQLKSYLTTELVTVIVEFNNDAKADDELTPIDRDTIRFSCEFILSLKPGIPRPEIYANNNGSISIDWSITNYRSLSTRIDNTGVVYYAAYFSDTDRHMGRNSIGTVFPEEIERLIERVYSNDE